MDDDTLVPHLIFTNGRSGSNHLVDAINQHPELCNYGEVLGPYMLPRKLHDRIGYGGRDVESYLETVYVSRFHFELAQLWSAISHVRERRPVRRKRWARLRSVGVKDFAIRFDESGLAHFPLEQSDLRVISLVRENTLDRVLSILSLRARGQVAAKSSADAGLEGLQVDVDELMMRLDLLESEKVEQQRIVDAIPDDRLFRLTYEDFHADPERRDELTADMFRFLGVEPIEVEGRHRKLLSTRLEDAVANHEEVIEAVASSRFARYLPTDVTGS